VAANPAPAAPDAKMIEFDLGELSLDLDSPAAPAPAAAAAVVPAATAAVAAPAAAEPEPKSEPVPFTLPKTEKFRVGAAAEPAELRTQGLEDGGGDPLATKFALAQEFNAIGDPDGARSLAEEVLAEASGDLKSRAQKFLAEIG
jgi:pilus assembly protein FimV